MSTLSQSPVVLAAEPLEFHLIDDHFTVTVPYSGGRTISALLELAAGRLSRMCSNPTDNCFRYEKSGIEEMVRFRFGFFNRTASRDEAFEVIAKSKLRPVSCAELLAMGARHAAPARPILALQDSFPLHGWDNYVFIGSHNASAVPRGRYAHVDREVRLFDTRLPLDTEWLIGVTDLSGACA